MWHIIDEGFAKSSKELQRKIGMLFTSEKFLEYISARVMQDNTSIKLIYDGLMTQLLFFSYIDKHRRFSYKFLGKRMVNLPGIIFDFKIIVYDQNKQYEWDVIRCEFESRDWKPSSLVESTMSSQESMRSYFVEDI